MHIGVLIRYIYIYILLFLTTYVLYTHVYLAIFAGMCEIVAQVNAI